MITEINNEVKSEIIKAHIYGHSVEEIASIMQIDTNAVAEVLNDTEEIEKQRNNMAESGWI